MPWCPKCKTEYRDGITKCSDCGTPLIAELGLTQNGITLCYINNESVADRLLSYLEYSGIKAASEFDPEENSYKILVNEKDQKKATTEYKGFLMVEASKIKDMMSESYSDKTKRENDTENVLEPDIENEELKKTGVSSLEDLKDLEKAPLSDADKEALLKMAGGYKPAGVYQSQSDKASDLYSTGYTFLIIGAAMLIFTALCLFHVIPVFTDDYLTLSVLAALSLAACGVGISSFKRSKKASSQVDAEKKLIDDINEWLEKNKSIMTDGELSGNDGTTDEILYLKRTSVIKRAMFAKFGELDEDFADNLIDEFYNKNF